MRTSCDKKDFAYRGEGLRGKVWVDGVEVKDVITADEDQGHVIRFARNLKGEFLGYQSRSLVKERLYGKVKTEITEWPANPVKPNPLRCVFGRWRNGWILFGDAFQHWQSGGDRLFAMLDSCRPVQETA